jgi:pimeloyl-ACP methyl ester carboxylesterase
MTLIGYRRLNLDRPRRVARRGFTLLIIGASSILLLVLSWSAFADTLLVRQAEPPPGDTGQFTSVDGVRTYYRVIGQGPALVLLHGLGSSHLTWSAVDAAFARQFTVYEVDLPGFGYSDKPAGITSARAEASFVDQFLASRGVERATVIGHSMGGDVALWLAAEHPDRVERLVIVDAAEIGEAAAVFRLAATPVVGDLMLKATTTPLTLPRMMADPYVQKQALTQDMSKQYARMYWSPGARQAMVELAASYDVDKAALLGSIGGVPAPTLIVWADHDPYFPVAVGEHLRDLLPEAEMHVIANSGHLPQEEQPAIFGDLVLGWLRR